MYDYKYAVKNSYLGGYLSRLTGKNILVLQNFGMMLNKYKVILIAIFGFMPEKFFFIYFMCDSVTQS
jgi:hypothetical protein